MRIGEKLGCYLCVPFEQRMYTNKDGFCTMTENEKLPQRKIVRIFISNRADPTETYVLDCGHTII